MIDVNVVIEGEVELGDNVEIGANCVIKNAKIGANTKIAPFSHFEGCEVGENNQIGPYARLRPQAKLADDVHIGNFVEVKNATIGNGTKANHLTYIGDAEVGSKTNFGAGTIIANYDGVNKYKTVIGERSPHRFKLRLNRPRNVGQQSDDRRGQRDYPQLRRRQTRSRPFSPNRHRRLGASGKRR